MAAITANSLTAGMVTTTRVTLGASDTFTFNESKNQILILDNVTAGALTVVIDGDGATTVPVPGVGTMTISGGFSTGSIAAGAQVAIPLNAIKKYCAGVIAVTGGTGIKATLLQY